MKYNSLMSAIEETGSTKAYYQQFSNVTPILGGVYKVTGSGIITDYVEIIAEVDEVVIGKLVKDTNGGSNVGTLNMYYSSGVNSGWKYGDSRPNYRLKEI